MDPAGRFALFYRVVRSVPRGRVTTYGQVALLAGMPGYARHVGHALAALRGTAHRVPWHRVLGKAGKGWARIAILDAMGAGSQRALLEREGVAVDDRGRVRLADHGWPALQSSARGTARKPKAKRARAPRSRGGAPTALPAGRGRSPRVIRSAPASRPRSRPRTRGSSGRS